MSPAQPSQLAELPRLNDRQRHPGQPTERRFGRGKKAGWPGLEAYVRSSTIRIVAVVCLLTVFSGSAPGLSAATSTAFPASDHLSQVDDSGAADAARAFSQLEAERAFGELYERMHPDALEIVPRSAVVGWYEAFFSGRDTAELTVTGVEPEPWTWGVTGVTYEDAVTVRFVQPYSVAGVEDEVAGEVHLVPLDGKWVWFFGASRAFVDEQIALYGDDGTATLFSLSQEDAVETPVPRDVLFPDPLHAHVDQFWAARFQEAGRTYESPGGVIAFDEPIVTACGRAEPDEEAAFYCVIDEKIYYSSEFRALIEAQIGDFAWVIVVAHEWGHHIQATLGFDLGVVPDRAGEILPIELEQQADCVAGAYASDAEVTGWLDPGDIDEALYMTQISGDPPGTAWNDPRAHGSGDERINAFTQGYTGGLIGCDLDLTAG